MCVCACLRVDAVQTSQEEKLKQKLLEEQFLLLQGTVAEAENIIQDAVAKLDDPLHIRCTSSPGQTPSPRQATPDPFNPSAGFTSERSMNRMCKYCRMSFNPPACLSVHSDYLISRAEAALGSVDKVKKGHADYVRDMAGELAVAHLQLHTLDDPKHEVAQSINHLLFLKR